MTVDDDGDDDDERLDSVVTSLELLLHCTYDGSKA